MTKKLIYTFGPDGAGKSTLIQSLADTWPESLVLQASRPESWPDTSWHREIVARSIDPATKDPAYHLTTLERCYAMVGGLLCAESTAPLIIDSDPRAQIAVKACTLYDHPMPLADFYDQLDNLVAKHIGYETQQLGLHITIGKGTPEQRAEALVQRIKGRDIISPFDPISVGEARDLVTAFDALETILEERKAPLIRIETDQSLNPLLLSAQVMGAPVE